MQTKDIIEYLKRLSKTSIPDGIEQFIKVSILCIQSNLWQLHITVNTHIHVHVVVPRPI